MMTRLSFDSPIPHRYPISTLYRAQNPSRVSRHCLCVLFIVLEACMLHSRSRHLRIGVVACWLLASLVWLGTLGQVYADTGSTFSLTNTIQGTDTVWRVRVTSDGARFVAYTSAGITVRRMSDSSVVWSNPVNGYFAISPDGELLVTAGADSSDLNIRVWRMRDGHHLRTITLPDTYIVDVAFTPDGARLIGIGGSQIISWRVTNWRRIWTVTGDDDSVSSVVVSPDGQTFATSNQTAQAKVWRVQDAQLLHAFPNQSWGTGDPIAYSPDSQFLATAGIDPIMSVWQLSTGQLAAQWTVASSAILSIGYRPDGNMLAISYIEGPITMWHMGDYALQQTLLGHTSGANSIAFSPNSRTLVSGGSDSLINIWSQTQ
jgi:WD40 repeat protein